MGITLILKHGTYENCIPDFGYYPADKYQPYLRFRQEHELLLTASVMMEGQPVLENHIWIKDWAENEGVLASLVNAGWLVDTGRTTQAGYEKANLCKITKVMRGALNAK